MVDAHGSKRSLAEYHWVDDTLWPKSLENLYQLKKKIVSSSEYELVGDDIVKDFSSHSCTLTIIERASQ